MKHVTVEAIIAYETSDAGEHTYACCLCPGEPIVVEDIDEHLKREHGRSPIVKESGYTCGVLIEHVKVPIRR